MSILFRGQSINLNHYHLGNYNVDRIPSMTDSDVETVNSSRKLPEGYYFVTKEQNWYKPDGKLNTGNYYHEPDSYKPVMTIIKGEKVLNNDLPQYYDTLPEGLTIEKNFLGTFLKKSDVKSALFNYYRIPICAILGACSAKLYFGLKNLKK